MHFQKKYQLLKRFLKNMCMVDLLLRCSGDGDGMAGDDGGVLDERASF